MDVGTDYDPEADFAALRTYAWLPDHDRMVGERRIYDTLLDRRVRNAVDRELAARGYSTAAADVADFYVVYHAGIETKIDVRSVNSALGYGEGLWGRDIGPGADVREYEQGTLLLDILRRDGRQLLWRGSASDPVSDTDDPEKRTRRIDEAVGLMLDRFPPS
jgi:hypothetical protein